MTQLRFEVQDSSPRRCPRSRTSSPCSSEYEAQYYPSPLKQRMKAIVEHCNCNKMYSGLSKSNFKDYYQNAVIKQCLGKIAEINEFSAFDEML